MTDTFPEYPIGNHAAIETPTTPAPLDTTASDDERPVLVTGTTGFIGMEVTRRLAAEEVPVRAMFRRRHRAALISPLAVDLRMGDLRSIDSLRRAVEGCRAVIHLAGRATFERYDLIAPTIVDGARAMAEAAAEAGVDRFVFGSSLFVHGPQDGPVVDDDSSTNPVLDYGRAKVEAEAAIADILGDRALSIRLPHVYGSQDLLFGFLRRGLLPFPADLDGVFPHMHVGDAARALIAGVAADRGGPLAVADDEPVTWEHFFEVVRLYLPGARIIPLPVTPSRWGAAVLERIVPGRFTNMATADTIKGWNLDLRVKPRSLAALDLEADHHSVDTGIPAVFDAAIPYRWIHPVMDHKRY